MWYPVWIEWTKILRKVQGLVGMIALGVPKVEIPEKQEEMEVESRLLVVMLPVDKTRVIPIPLLIVTNLSPHPLIRVKS